MIPTTPSRNNLRTLGRQFSSSEVKSLMHSITASPKRDTFSILEASSFASLFLMLSFSHPGRSVSYPAEVAAGCFSFYCSTFLKLFTSHYIKRTFEFKVCFSYFCRPEKEKKKGLFLSSAKCRSSGRIRERTSGRIKWLNCLQAAYIMHAWLDAEGSSASIPTHWNDPQCCTCQWHVVAKGYCTENKTGTTATVDLQ